MAFEKGSRLGHYEILGRLGGGGMGEVLRARDLNLPREVAIKIVRSADGGDAEHLRRFREEGKKLAQVTHKNLLTIYEFGYEDDVPFIVTELLHGQTLRSRLRKGYPLPLRTALRYAIDVALGLSAIHGHRFCHRDLKPDNLFITADDDRMVILDFGLAKEIVNPRDVRDEDPTHPQHTPYGAAPGTIGYKSPEQAESEELDERSDIFALGVVLYEMLSGRQAFHTDHDTVFKEVDPLPHDIPATVDWIVRRCLEKSRGDRYTSAHDVCLVLRGELNALSLATPPAPHHVRRQLVTVVVAGTAAVLASVAVSLWIAARSPIGSAAPRFTQLTSRSQERDPSLAPDGKSFAFVSDVEGDDDIYVQSVGGRALNVTKSATTKYPDTEPAFSPDGSRIAFRSEREGGGIFVMGTTGEEKRKLSPVGYNPSWSPDGTQIVVGTDNIAQKPAFRERISDLWLIDVRRGTARLLFKGDAVQPDWSPHGNRIAYWALIGNGGQRDLFTIDPHAADPGKTVTRITNDAALDWNPTWSPDGKWLYFGSNRGGTMNFWRIAMDEATGRRRGDPEPVTVPSRFASHMSIARETGEIAFSDYSATATFWSVRFDPLAVHAVGAPAPIMSGALLPYGASSYAPDGSFAFSNSGVQEDIFLMDAGGELRQLTRDAEKDRVPAFSPDGSIIYFYSQHDDRYEVWSIQPDGNGLQRVSYIKDRPVWLPQPLLGHNALFASNESGTFILPFEGKRITRKVPLPPMPDPQARLIAAAASADGSQMIGLVRTSGPSFGIWIYSVDSHTYEHVLSEGTDPDWGSPLNMTWIPGSPNLVLARFRKKLHVIDLAARTMRAVSQPIRPVESFSLSTDGRTLQVVEPAVSSSIWLMRTH